MFSGKMENRSSADLVSKDKMEGVEKGAFDLVTERGEPLYFSFLSEEESLNADASAINEAKNKLQAVFAGFPEEVHALDGKSESEVKENLLKLYGAIEESDPGLDQAA